MSAAPEIPNHGRLPNVVGRISQVRDVAAVGRAICHACARGSRRLASSAAGPKGLARRAPTAPTMMSQNTPRPGLGRSRWLLFQGCADGEDCLWPSLNGSWGAWGIIASSARLTQSWAPSLLLGILALGSQAIRHQGRETGNHGGQVVPSTPS